MLIQVDLPALERPTKAISGTSSSGKKCNWGAVVRKRAVCNQPIATTAGDLAVASATDGAGGVPGGFEVLVIDLKGKPRAAL